MTAATYLTATTVEEAVAALAAGARPVAGGTDLVVGGRQGKEPLPRSLVGIHRIAGLAAITETDAGLDIGALVSHAAIVDHPAIRDHYPGLADACALVGSHATRAHGTIGGNVMNASPAMDTGAPLLCHGGAATLASSAGRRTVDLADLWSGPGTTTAGSDELLVTVHLPAPPPGTASAYVRLQYRRHMEIAVVGAAAAITLDGDVVTDAALAITALAPVIHRVPAAEHALVGTAGDAPAVEAAAEAAAAAARPVDDVRASAAYRRAMAAVVARRAIQAALGRARGEEMPIPASESTYGGLIVTYPITLNVNGVPYPLDVDPHATLLHVVREQVGLTGSKEGCDDSECGACMMLLDGQPVNSCSYLAVQADGAAVTTVEGLAPDDSLAPLQEAFLTAGGVQCGFCTPGMLISATYLLDDNPHPSADEVRLALSGNLCRCTGYDGIVRAVLEVASRRTGTEESTT